MELVDLFRRAARFVVHCLPAPRGLRLPAILDSLQPQKLSEFVRLETCDARLSIDDGGWKRPRRVPLLHDAKRLGALITLKQIQIGELELNVV